MNRYLVWNPDDSDEEVGVTIETWGPDDAAEDFAEQDHDGYCEGAYGEAGNDPADGCLVLVRDLATGELTRWRVGAESITVSFLAVQAEGDEE